MEWSALVLAAAAILLGLTLPLLWPLLQLGGVPATAAFPAGVGPS
jgi:hypothetical protein